MKDHNHYLAIIAIAVLIKLFLFAFLISHAPQNRFLSDSNDYLTTAKVLSCRAAFAKEDSAAGLRYETLRTPGYPVFLALLNGLARVPINGIIFIQILLSLLAALITYQAAVRIDARIGFLSAVIVLYDPPVSIFSLIILAETLFLFLMAVFMLSFVKYLNNRKTSMLVWSALVLAAATYVRPISYYLGAAVAIFILYANFRQKPGRAFTQALIFLLIVYSLLGAWQARNYIRCREKSFASIIQQNCSNFGLLVSTPRDNHSIDKASMPGLYYTSTTLRCLASLLTRPGPFKYFQSQALNVTAKALAYPWMAFWMVGFIIGTVKIGRNIYYQFIFLVIIYFIVTSIGGVAWLVGERFRVPMCPFIAVISAYGWVTIASWAKNRNARLSGQRG